MDETVLSHYVNPSVAIPPTLEITTEAPSFKSVAGTNSSLTLKVRNLDSRPVCNLKFTPNFKLMHINLTPDLPRVMAPGAEYSGTLQLSVPKDAPTGTYQWNAKLKGEYEA